MIIGLGIDIIEIDRIKSSIERFGDKFLNKIYTENEIRYCSSKTNKYQHFAARFAAKEAVAKALSSIYNESWQWKNIEIINNRNGLPEISLNGNLVTLLEKRELKLSITHSGHFAAAAAVLSSSI
jgi:holo-[acyl-carrier protein] synthase